MKRPMIGALAILMAAGGVSLAQEPRAFLELFTSQGCAACPAADRLIGDLNDQEGVFAVTMPVKLWDFLGWRDTLATEAATKRQMTYSVSRGDRDVYTPQLIVNGKAAVLGSDAEAIQAAIDKTPEAGLPLPIDLSVADGVLSIDVGEADIGAPEATLWFIVVEQEVSVPIGGGENRGRNLTYHNVVKQMRPVGMYKGKAMSLDLPLSDIEKAPNAACFVIAQIDTFKGPGKVVGAAELRKLFPARVVKNSG